MRRSRVKRGAGVRYAGVNQLLNPDIIYSSLIWLLFVCMCVAVLGYDSIKQSGYVRLTATAVVILLICLAMAFYVSQYQKRLLKNHAGAVGLAALLMLLLTSAKISFSLTGQTFWAVATAVAAALVLAICYSQRFATVMTFVYCFLVYLVVGLPFGAGPGSKINLLLIMLAAALPFCFFLKEITYS